LANDVDGLVKWIARTEHIKPGVLMPQFGMLPEEELKAMAVYLKGLK
jgi:cytochrome c oxidase subunit 2